MLNTLLTLGKEISQQQGEWDSLIEIPKYNDTTKNGEPITNYVLVVTFDCDNESIFLEDGLNLFSASRSPGKYRNINSELWGRNGDPWMVTCNYPNKLSILQKSIFGKPDKGDLGQGFFLKSLLKTYPEVRNTTLCKALEACYTFKDMLVDDLIKGIDILNKDYISKKIVLPRNHRIVMLSIAIKNKQLGINEPTLLCQLEGFEIVKQRFSKQSTKQIVSNESLCYITGKNSPDVTLPSFSDREDLNKLFVTTTINYASNFDQSKYKSNYQIDINVQKALQNGSNYIRGKLNNQRCSVRIAGIEHYIIPTFLNPETIDIKFELDNIREMNEWVFSTKQMDNTFTAFDSDNESGIYWIHYIAYVSDGNSVKVINHIKDVSNIWFNHIIKQTANQSKIISNYFNSYSFNFLSVYYSIPVRKDKETKNDALKLLSQILEQRKIKSEKIFNHFCELILCHFFERYRSYTNITPKSDNFTLAIKDSLIKYFFLFNLLKSLNLIDMINNEKTVMETHEIPDKLKQFFSEMGYSSQHQSLYWLGNIIWRIGKAQLDKGHKQIPILSKINFNGMDYPKVQKLFVDAFELATQYNIASEINYASNKFQQNFPANHVLWLITPQEAVFYILSGYSLYIK